MRQSGSASTPSWRTSENRRLADMWMDHSVKGKGISLQPEELHLRALAKVAHTDRPTKYLSISKERARESNELSQRSEGGE